MYFKPGYPFAVLCLSAFLMVLPGVAPAATVDSDGGITMWMSFDNADSLSAVSIDTTVTTDVAGCSITNDARAEFSAGDSPSSCPNGDASCSAREKIEGDLQRLASYIYESTEGANYLKKVFVEDYGKSWADVDARVDLSNGISSASVGGWDDDGAFINMRRFWRTCIHDVFHHEFGHYFHNLPDRYESDITRDYYFGTVAGSDAFNVGVTQRDENTVMSNNFPHRFVDETNASITIEYTPPSASSPVLETLTPALLTDADSGNDGPLRAHHGFTDPFALDEWAVLSREHINLENVHTSGDFPTPSEDDMPALDIEFVEADDIRPGSVLLLDRSGSMGVLTDGQPASDLVQEAGLALYHSAAANEFVGTMLYNQSVESLFDYQEYDSTNTLASASFRAASGSTDIERAMQEGIDALIDEHGEGNVSGGRLILMSDGKQTVGDLTTQVERARNLGIKISTMAFGDADTTWMDYISRTTSGSTQELAEREDGNELKVQLTRFANEQRGYTPILRYKGRLYHHRIRAHGDGEKYEQQFVVPPKSRSLKLYVFADTANAADYPIELISPTGVVTRHAANSLATRGRFNGVNLRHAEAGTWTYRLIGLKPGHLSRQANFEILGYVEHRQIDTDVKVSDASTTNPWLKRIDASLNYRYPIADADAIAYIYLGSHYVGGIRLYDDGERGEDVYGLDGQYANVVDLRQFRIDQLLQELAQKRQRPPKLRFDVRFVLTDRAGPAPTAHYESGTDFDELVKDYTNNIKSSRTFSIWDTRYNQVRIYQRKAVASAQLLNVKSTLSLYRARTTYVAFEINAVTPRARDLRLSAGDGVVVKLVSLKPNSRFAGVRGVVALTPGRFAKSGTRVLNLQFSHTHLQARGTMTVR